MSLPITLTLGTLISLLGAAGHVIYGTIDFTTSGIDGAKAGTSLSKILTDRCSEIVEDLQQVDKSILITGRGARVIQQVVLSLKWANKYEHKMKITKILFNNSYKNKFLQCHTRLTIYYNELVLSHFFTTYFPSQTTSSIDSISKLYNKTGIIDISDIPVENNKRRFSFYL